MSGSFDRKVFLPNSTWCFVCGEENHAGLKTRFYVEEGFVKAKLSPQAHHCGYQSIVHGGVVAAILDECMGWAAARAIGRMCVTGELTVRYVQSVPTDRELTVVTEVVKASRRLVLTRGTLVDDGGATYARSEGKFSPLTIEETLKVDDQLLYRGGEERIFESLRDHKERA